MVGNLRAAALPAVVCLAASVNVTAAAALTAFGSNETTASTPAGKPATVYVPSAFLVTVNPCVSLSSIFTETTSPVFGST